MPCDTRASYSKKTQSRERKKERRGDLDRASCLLVIRHFRRKALMGSAAVTAVAAGQKQMAERERFEPLLLPPPSPARFIRWRERASPDKVSAIESGDADGRTGATRLPCSFHPEPTQIFIGESGFSGTPKTSPDSSYFPLALKTLFETYK